MSETEESEMVPSEPATSPSMDVTEEGSFEGEHFISTEVDDDELATLEEGGGHEEARGEKLFVTEDHIPDAVKTESRIEEDEEGMSVVSHETEDDFSEYEQYESDELEETPHAAEEEIDLFPSSEVVKDPEITSKTPFSTVTSSSIVPLPSQRKPSAKGSDRGETPSTESYRRKMSIDENDEEIAKIQAPSMKPNKVIPKLPEPKYPLWPVKIFETENIYKIMEKAVPRFFPRNYPYVLKDVTRRINMLTEYLQRKVFQMGHDRRKLITVVRYHQTNWNGQKSVVRWLWCMETDALVKYIHHGESYVVSAIIIGLYVD